MQHQCLSNGQDGGFTKDVLLGFKLIPPATSPLSLLNFFLLIFTSLFTFTLLSQMFTHCTTILPTASRVAVKLKLSELCFCTTPLSLWQREGNEERPSSASQHCYRTIKCTFKSLRWVISSKGKKHVPHCIPGSIYAHFTASWLFFWNPTPLKESDISPMKTKQNKTNLSLSFLMISLLSKLGVLLDFFLFSYTPTIMQ